MHDSLFSDPISKIYEKYLVALIFEPYAPDLAARLSGLNLSRVLEVAAGTGVATRSLAAMLPAHVSIVATVLISLCWTKQRQDRPRVLCCGVKPM